MSRRLERLALDVRLAHQLGDRKAAQDARERYCDGLAADLVSRAFEPDGIGDDAELLERCMVNAVDDLCERLEVALLARARRDAPTVSRQVRGRSWDVRVGGGRSHGHAAVPALRGGDRP